MDAGQDGNPVVTGLNEIPYLNPIIEVSVQCIDQAVRFHPVLVYHNGVGVGLGKITASGLCP